jgi:uncharacterized protein
MATLASDIASKRIVTLDTIRGIAVMGIFSVNVIAFAMIESAYFNPAAYGGHKGPDLGLWALNMVLIDGKMRTLFSMLFGASMLLVVERAEASGRSGWWTHFRRMAVLLVFGLAHYYLVWFGDILTLYAVSGLCAFMFRRMSPRALVISGIIWLVLHELLFAGFLYSQYLADIAAHAPGASKAAIKEWNDALGSFYPSAAEIAKDKARFLGTWLAYARHNLQHWDNVIQGILIFMPDTIGLMLNGMAGYKSGYLTGAWTDERYRRIASWSVPLGIAAGLGVVAIDVGTNFYTIAMMGSFVVLATPFITLMALGYAALIILLTRKQGWLALRIAAAGRCAFSNYLGTSIIASLIFFGWGLGLYGSLSRWQAWLVAPMIWTVMLLWSKPWLEHFHYGPFEWAWRSLSRGRPQPFRKSGAAAMAATT